MWKHEKKILQDKCVKKKKKLRKNYIIMWIRNAKSAIYYINNKSKLKKNQFVELQRILLKYNY